MHAHEGKTKGRRTHVIVAKRYPSPSRHGRFSSKTARKDIEGHSGAAIDEGSYSRWNVSPEITLNVRFPRPNSPNYNKGMTKEAIPRGMPAVVAANNALHSIKFSVIKMTQPLAKMC
eukprot:364818-Chlamydomonas_euryale.AAC.9